MEHEEVLLMPRWIEEQRVTFKYGIGAEFIDLLRTLPKLGLGKPTRCRSGGCLADGGEPGGRAGESPGPCSISPCG